MNEIEHPDPIDEAIAKTEQGDKPTALINDATLPDGRRIRLVVPLEFGPDEFETAVGMLMQLRVASEERRAAMNPPAIVVPSVPSLLRPDGSRLT